MSTRTAITAGVGILAIAAASFFADGQNSPANAASDGTRQSAITADMSGADLAGYFANRTDRYYEYMAEDGVVPESVAFCEAGSDGSAMIRDVASAGGNDIYAIRDIAVNAESGTCQHGKLTFQMR